MVLWPSGKTCQNFTAAFAGMVMFAVVYLLALTWINANAVVYLLAEVLYSASVHDLVKDTEI